MPHPDASLDVVALGNAIVDVISHADDDFLAAQNLVKGSMRLIEPDEAERLYAAMGPGIEASGGSAANTAGGVASFGGRAAYVGKVRDDILGQVFAHDIRAMGVAFHVPAGPDGPPTARSLILVTPDAQRTMNTCLGIAALLMPEDVDEELVSRASITYCEGYLWDVEVAKQAIRKAIAAAHAAGRRVALTLSDSFCVARHRDEWPDLIDGSIDILFANEHEVVELYDVPTFDDAVTEVRRHCDLAFLTRGQAGSVVVAGDELHVVDAHPVERLVDTTGAGDMYAAGVLYGLTAGHDLAAAARLGSLAAAEVIGHLGPRPEVSLAELAGRALSTP
ncbi:MAG: adenosine kinase [Acidimicrobiales bacterium]